MKKLRIVDKNTQIFVIQIVLMVIICVLHSLKAGHYADFYPINGTFQNYNPVRRMLDGQIAYRDFQDYLGMGHLYLGAIITAFFGGTYRASLMAFTFLTFTGLACILLCISMAIFSQRVIPTMITNICLLLLLIQPLFFSNVLCGTDEIASALYSALGTGNSARFVRGIILPLSVALMWIGWNKFRKVIEQKNIVSKNKMIIGAGYTGLIAGFSFVWSNDYGISCWVCFTIMTICVLTCKFRNIKKVILGTVIEFLSSIVSMCFFVELLTFGHLVNWLNSTFGTGGYQAWYFNSDKSYYIYDLDFSYIMLIQALFCLIYLYKLHRNNATDKAIIRYGIPAFTNMVSFCAVNEYKMLSGGNSREVALTVLFATVLFECLHLFDNTLKSIKKIILITSVVVGLAWCISTIKEEFIFNTLNEKEGMYIDALGGNITTYVDDLLKTKEFLNGEKFFSTYASAQEVMCDTYQPSGTDYLIHVLGEDARNNYLDSFKTGDFKYTVTIKDTTDVGFSEWEYWIQRANWFFYRKLYEDWHPVYVNSYQVYWERNEENDNNDVVFSGRISIVDIDDDTKKIIVQTDDALNGIADVYINYQINKEGRINSKLLFQRFLKIQNTGTLFSDSFFESNYLPKQSQEYIPIPIVNGYGEVTLSSCPGRNTYLELKDVSCSKVFSANYHYVEVINITDEDGNLLITIPRHAKYEVALKEASKFTINDKQYEILDTRFDDSYLYVLINRNDSINIDSIFGDTSNMFRID